MNEFCKHNIHESHYCGSCNREVVTQLKEENAELKRKIELAKNQRDAWIGECYKEDFGLREYTINKANEALKSIRGS